jgi:hypothetical protein
VLLWVAFGFVATVASGEFRISWGYLLVDIPLVAGSAGLAFLLTPSRPPQPLVITHHDRELPIRSMVEPRLCAAGRGDPYRRCVAACECHTGEGHVQYRRGFVLTAPRERQ